MEEIDYERELDELIEKCIECSSFLDDRYLKIDLIERDYRVVIENIIRAVKNKIMIDDDKNVFRVALKEMRESEYDFDYDNMTARDLCDFLIDETCLVDSFYDLPEYQQLRDMLSKVPYLHTGCMIYEGWNPERIEEIVRLFVERAVIHDPELIEFISKLLRS